MRQVTIDDVVEAWHEGRIEGNFREFLGLSAEQYASWLRADSESELPKMVEGPPERDPRLRFESDDTRICEFCGCFTNAKYRQCCDKGRDADHKRSLAESAARSVLHKEETAEGAIYRIECLVAEHGDEGSQKALTAIATLREVMGLPPETEFTGWQDPSRSRRRRKEQP